MNKVRDKWPNITQRVVRLFSGESVAYALVHLERRLRALESCPLTGGPHVWNNDGYTCVYCGLVREREEEDASTTSAHAVSTPPTPSTGDAHAEEIRAAVQAERDACIQIVHDHIDGNNDRGVCGQDALETARSILEDIVDRRKL